jgi:hypothetical protein
MGRSYCISIKRWCTKQTCLVGRNVAPLQHIILIPSQPIFDLAPQWCVLSGDTATTNFIVFALTQQRLEPTIYHINPLTATLYVYVFHVFIYKRNIVCSNIIPEVMTLSSGDVILTAMWRYLPFLFNFKVVLYVQYLYLTSNCVI